ncbi:MAG: Rpn family recombination-promoting nuclease/putative transposase [Candidatus Tectimicrobiota bacterium]
MRYDTTLKTLFQAPPPRLLQLLIGSQARTMLTVEYPTVQTRRPDLVVQLLDGRLYHLELQSTNDTAMPWRMLEYFSLLCQHYGQAPQQQVLYVGAGALTMTGRLAYPTLAFHYEVIDIRTLDGSVLLDSPVLEDNLLALLCQQPPPSVVVRRLLSRIAALPGSARDKALAALVILAGLRRLHPLVREEIRQMPITIDIRENPFLREIFEEGLQEGRQEGLQEGRQEGLQEGRRAEAVALLCRQLEHRFGPLPSAARQHIAEADLPTLEAWGMRLLDAPSLDVVLQTP